MSKSALGAFIATLTAPHQGMATKARLLDKIVPCATYQQAERRKPQASEAAEGLARL